MSTRSSIKSVVQGVVGVALVAAAITGVVLASGGERDAVKSYVAHLRAHETKEAHAMLTRERQREISADSLASALHTPLLGGSTDLTVLSSSTSSAGKGCVTASVETGGSTEAVHFYVLDEDGSKRIQAVLTNDDFTAAPGLTSIEPWRCK